MKSIIEVKDVIEFILDLDKIELDTSSASDMHIPIYDISSEEFLNFAESEIEKGSKEDIINCISNLKRALDCKIDMFFESINLKKVVDKANLKFEKKTEFLANIGLFPIRTINKINLTRNKLEHEYKIPQISDLYTYYELVWDVIKIIDLNIELLYMHGEISLVFYSGNNEYYFTLKHDIDNRAFEFKIIDWTNKENIEQQNLIVQLKNKENIHEFIMSFNIYLLTIQYFDFENINMYKSALNKLIEKGT